MFCGHCGKEIAENSQFCPDCGKPVSIIGTLTDNKEAVNCLNPTQELVVPVKRMHKKLILSISIGIIAVLAILAGFIFWPKPTQDVLRVDDMEFLISASDYQKRFNNEVTGSLHKIKEFDSLEAYGYIMNDAQLEPNLEITLMCNPDTKNVVCIQLKADTDMDKSQSFEKYLLCIFHACDPTATPQDNTDFLSTIWDTKFNEYDFCLESKFYNKNDIAYQLEINTESIDFIVIPGVQDKGVSS